MAVICAVIRSFVGEARRNYALCRTTGWHLDEVAILINGRRYWHWRAVDANGSVLDILVQHQHNAKAARLLLKRLIARFGEPRVIATDKLRSYFVPMRELAPNAYHRTYKGLNNRIEVSHRPT
jgi:putative transposase